MNDLTPQLVLRLHCEDGRLVIKSAVEATREGFFKGWTHASTALSDVSRLEAVIDGPLGETVTSDFVYGLRYSDMHDPGPVDIWRIYDGRSYHSWAVNELAILTTAGWVAPE